ncbi:hypothetical protein HY993_04435 [Candidatus Micrarchaeota archaeon]|nr:hypothetical protein [Candidatus Micrarchaeota archaeon]
MVERILARAQFTIEFMITIGFLLTMFFLFQAYLWQKAGSGVDAASIQEAKAIGIELQNQFSAALNSEGYSSRILLPDTLQNYPYSLTIYNNSVVLEWKNYTFETPVALNSFNCPDCYPRSGGYALSNPRGVFFVSNVGGVISFYAQATPTPTAGSDVTPPVLSNLLPAGISNNRSVYLSVSTDENATCKYDAADVSYDSMANSFSSTGLLSHNQSLSLYRGVFSYYARCSDVYGNKNPSSSLISFTIEPVFALYYPSLGRDYFDSSGTLIPSISDLNAIDASLYTIRANIPKSASAFDDTKNLSLNFTINMPLSYYIEQVLALNTYQIDTNSVAGNIKFSFKKPSVSYGVYTALPLTKNTNTNYAANLTFSLDLHDPADLNALTAGITAYTTQNKNAKTMHNMVMLNVSYYTG